MKKLYAAFVFVLFFLLCTSVLYAADLREGFLGTKWGTSISSLGGFSKLWTKGKVSFYVNPNEIHTIYDISVPHVVYGFYADQFFAVYIRIESLEAYGKIKKYMTSKYGNPKKTLTMKNEQTIYRWKYKNIKIKLKFYEKVGNMKLSFYYTPLSNKVNEIQQEEFYDKSYQFFPIDKNKKPERLPLLVF